MNLLVNGDYSGATYRPKGEMGLTLPTGWECGCLDRKEIRRYMPDGVMRIGWYPTKYGPRARPNMAVVLKPEIEVISKKVPYLDPPRIPEGATNAIKAFKTQGTFCCWLKQTVKVVPGHTYRLSAQAHAWAHAPEDPDGAYYTHGLGKGPFAFDDTTLTASEVNQVNFRFRLGIDPDGRDNPFDEAVVWGKNRYIYNCFDDIFPVEVVARADDITVYLSVDNLWGWVNSDAYVGPTLLEDVTPEEGPINYVVVVNLLPQDATMAEKAFVLNAVHDSKQTILQSADDARRLVLPGMLGSRVVVWAASRWGVGSIVDYLAPCVVEPREF